MKNDNYYLGQLNRPVSQIDIQHNNMVGFVVEGHILWLYIGYASNSVYIFHKDWSLPQNFYLIKVRCQLYSHIARATISKPKERGRKNGRS